MRRSSLVLPLVAALALLGGGAALTELAAGAFQRPKLTFRAASLEALDLEGATVGFRYDLENPNGVGLSLARLGYGVEVEGTRIATGDLPGGLRIPAGGTAPITFPVRVRFRDVPGIANLLGASRDRIAYKLSGTVGVSTPIGVIDLPLSHDGALDLPRLPKFQLEGLQVRSVSFTDVAVDLKVRVGNPNAFAVPGGQLDWALALGGAQVARGDAKPLGTIAAGGSTVLAIPFRVNLASASRAASELARGGVTDVRLSGKADLAGIPIPLDLAAKLPARR
jgi:LEA14-like dessication related protein